MSASDNPKSKIQNLKSSVARVFAVVPAAGHSRRMGQPKLLLNVGGQTVIRRLVEALRAGGATVVYVLVRESDLALQAELACTSSRVVLTSDTPDMRASVAVILDAVRREQSPRPSDAWLLAPADHPLLQADVIAELLAARQSDRSEILVPVHAGRRGHPTCFTWNLADAVGRIPEGAGLNRLLHDHPELVREVPMRSDAVLFDLDTPDDLLRLRRS